MEDHRAQTIGQLRRQLVTCQADLERAVEQLKEVEVQLKQAGDPTAAHIGGLMEKIVEASGQLEPVMKEIEHLDDEDGLLEHQDKLVKISKFFQELEGLKGDIA